MFTSIPGRSGSLTTLEGIDVYDDYIATAECMIADMSRLPEICGYLKGAGTVTFANRPGGFFKARITNQISFDKILRGNPHRSFTVSFRLQPFFYLDDSGDITLTESGEFISNPGNVHSEPVITVNGSGDITLMVGTTIVTLMGVEESITIDTPLLEAYKGIVSQNTKMSGDFPILMPGANAISWTGDVSSVVVTPNWRNI